MEFKYDQSGYMPFEDTQGQNIPLLLVGFSSLGLPQITNIVLKDTEDGENTLGSSILC